MINLTDEERISRFVEQRYNQSAARCTKDANKFGPGISYFRLGSLDITVNYMYIPLISVMWDLWSNDKELSQILEEYDSQKHIIIQVSLDSKDNTKLFKSKLFHKRLYDCSSVGVSSVLYFS